MDALPLSDSITFIGTATTLIELGPFRILTDPNFVHRHEKVDIGYGMTATRLTDPAMDIDQLPPLDLVLLSHFHGDHFDQVAERDLDHGLTIVTNPSASKSLDERGFTNLRPLETWATTTFSKADSTLHVTATPGRHGPPIVSMALPDVMGELVQLEVAGEITRGLYITGDTLVIDDLKELPKRYPGIDVAMLHLGGTRVMGVLVTMGGHDAVELIRMVEPKVAIPIHYDDYDVFKEPLDVFRDAVAEASLNERVRYIGRGEKMLLPTG